MSLRCLIGHSWCRDPRHELTEILQECIPVGCVPPASVAVSGESSRWRGVWAGVCQGGCLPWWASAQGRCLPRVGGCLPRGESA